MLSIKLKRRLNYYDGLIRCPHCREYFFLKDNVNMDIMHTLTHSHCQPLLTIKDSGTFQNILERHPQCFPQPTQQQQLAKAQLV
ncbi:hypothetical protein CWS01_09310 [Niallia nealsonii]|uniref:Uncharacterized protein n=1 Tax=Niallia nealsonii TaxID=115979 RepID=A0A2N0Z392_9BACI|nr:hypothetical protein CWS01_09310 [Niallia nealsonii]